MGPAETEEYAKAVVMADLDEPGIEDVMRKVMADVAERGTDITEGQVRAKISNWTASRLSSFAERADSSFFSASTGTFDLVLG